MKKTEGQTLSTIRNCAKRLELASAGSGLESYIDWGSASFQEWEKGGWANPFLSFRTSFEDIFLEVWYGSMLTDRDPTLWVGLGFPDLPILTTYLSNVSMQPPIYEQTSYHNNKPLQICIETEKARSWLGVYADPKQLTSSEFIQIVNELIAEILQSAKVMKDSAGLNLERLREIAIEAANTRQELAISTDRLAYQRSSQVRAYVLKRANGKCEYCSGTSFYKFDGTVYLESHHVEKVSDGGLDHPSSVAALCSNCHRKAHFGRDKEEMKSELLVRVRAFEECFGHRPSQSC